MPKRNINKLSKKSKRKNIIKKKKRTRKQKGGNPKNLNNAISASGLLSNMNKTKGMNLKTQYNSSDKILDGKSLKEVAEHIISLKKQTNASELLKNFIDAPSEIAFQKFLDLVERLSFYQMEGSLNKVCQFSPSIISENKNHITPDHKHLGILRQELFTYMNKEIKGGINFGYQYYLYIEAYWIIIDIMDKMNEQGYKAEFIDFLNKKIRGFRLEEDGTITLTNEYVSKNNRYQYYIPNIVNNIGTMAYFNSGMKPIGRIGSLELCDKYPDKCAKSRDTVEGYKKFESEKYGPNSEMGRYIKDNYGKYGISIPESVTVISSHAFDLPYLISMELSKSVTKIGDSGIGSNAFFCPLLSALTIPDSMDEISSFKSCPNIKIVNLLTREKKLKIDIYESRYKLFHESLMKLKQTGEEMLFLRDGKPIPK